MKIKIAYTEPEKERADELAAMYLREMQQRGAVTLTRSDRHKPYYHIYISDRKKSLDNSKNI